jgi:hypothetical protein
MGWVTRAVALAALVAAVAAPTAGAVVLRGTAYQFNATPVIAGANIRVLELPSAHATTRSDGSYALTVPNRATVTPYIVAPGYHTIYLQTFRTAGQDLRNVNFQTPTDDVYSALTSLLNVPLDANGDVAQCAVVSTFNTRNVRDLDYKAFRAYGAHGVAGATAFTLPPLSPPTYFNAQVIPDPGQPVSSDDGGVVWVGVPAGTYRIGAQAPGTAFASFTATCAPGRVINANPPWGLYQLSPASPARIRARWNGTRLASVTATQLPPQSTLRATCAGSGCPFTVRLMRARGSSATFLRNTRFGAGQVLDVAAFSHAYNAAVERYRITGNSTPRGRTMCIPDGLNRPHARCRTG